MRGRVGRSGQPAYCLLIAENEDEMHNQRLRAMQETDDGFELAKQDLSSAGRERFTGCANRADGPEHMLSPSSKLLEISQQEAHRIFSEDPDLTQDQHALLALLVREIWQKPKENLVSSGS